LFRFVEEPELKGQAFSSDCLVTTQKPQQKTLTKRN
jgi:hypothetical protein